MTGVVLAACAALGVLLVYTGLAAQDGVEGRKPSWWSWRSQAQRHAGAVLARLGLTEVKLLDLVAMTMLATLGGGVLGWGVFGAVLPALIAAACAGALPAAGLYAHNRRAREAAHECWPRLIDELRIRVASTGRSIPQALFEAGERAPEVLRPAFLAAQREWLLSTDFARTLSVLKARLADPTADAVCETLLVAHEVGGTELCQRLEALVADRRLEVECRKEARARMSGARFARRFVLLVPAGMAVAGTSIGTGRAAYGSPLGQALVTSGLIVVAACWVWAGRLLRIPEPGRVFSGDLKP